MHRRTFLFGALGAAVASSFKSSRAAQSLGTIAYAQIDGLWVRALPDGEPTKLVGGPVSFPKFSPSGRWISYQQNGVSYVTSIDGNEVARVGFWWSPVSDELWTVNEDLQTLEAFGVGNHWSAPIATIRHASFGPFSPDGAEMIFATTDIDPDSGPSGTRLWRVELKDGAQPALLKFTKEDWSPFTWTRDGKSIVYWRQEEFSASEASDGNELFIMPVSGGEPRSLKVMTLLDSGFAVLSPKRNELAVTAGDGRYEWTNKRTAVIDLDSLAIRYLTSEGTVGLSPVWSPDGNRIAYSAGPAPAPEEESDLECGCDEASQKRLNELLSKRRIWVSDRTGAEAPRQLTADGPTHDEAPLWSADGRHILFTRSDAAFNNIHTLSSDQTALWLMDQDGAHPIQVAGPLSVEEEAYDDRRSAFDWFRGRP